MDFNNVKLGCECGGSMKKIKTKLKGFPVEGWKCNKCGEELIHPRDVDMIVDLVNAKKRNELKVKIREVGDSQVVTIPKIIRNFKELKKGMVTEWDIEDNKLVLKLPNKLI